VSSDRRIDKRNGLEMMMCKEVVVACSRLCTLEGVRVKKVTDIIAGSLPSLEPSTSQTLSLGNYR